MPTLSVGGGGAIIDTDTFAVGIKLPFVHATGDGGLTKQGSGTLTLSGGEHLYRTDNDQCRHINRRLWRRVRSETTRQFHSRMFAGATMDISAFNTQVGSLAGGGTTGGNVTLGGSTLSVGGDNTNPAPYAGVISGSGTVSKIGNGTQTFSGANTYVGEHIGERGRVEYYWFAYGHRDGEFRRCAERFGQ